MYCGGCATKIPNWAENKANKRKQWNMPSDKSDQINFDIRNGLSAFIYYIFFIACFYLIYIHIAA